MIELRPHHLYCMFFYQGKGYSQSFTQNMSYIIDYIQNHPKEPFLLVKSCDHICKACPYIHRDQCEWNNKVITIDEKIAQMYNLQLGAPYTYEWVKEHIHKQITTESLEYNCNQCEWFKKRICKL